MGKRYIDPEKIDFRLGALESDGELLIPLSAVRAAIAAAPSEDVVKKREVIKEFVKRVEKHLANCMFTARQNADIQFALDKATEEMKGGAE